jgi:UDP-GlcNAc:undecaprenyl-phosphate GlcNAc-1-phosphate transferase
LAAFLVTVASIMILRPVARRIGLLDRPGGRKAHDLPIPVTGGISMSVGCLAALFLFSTGPEANWGFSAGIVAFGALGVADDLLDLRPWTKLGAQAAAALVMTLPGHTLIGPADVMGLGDLRSLPIDALFTVVFVVGLANAFNMLDGVDGLAGGAAASALVWLASTAALAGGGATLSNALLLLGAVVGFLAFNARHPWRQRAAVFMGDAGSLMLGATIAYLMLELATGPRQPTFPALLWLIALPLCDTAILVLRRWAAGQSPFRADRRHVHHILLQAGLSPPAVTAVLVGACVVYGGIGVTGWLAGLSGELMLAALAVPFAAHSCLVLRRWGLVEHVRASARAPSRVPAELLARSGTGIP